MSIYNQNINIIGTQEISLNQGNIDGFNPEKQKAWL
jgi:hypothetical protein